MKSRNIGFISMALILAALICLLSMTTVRQMLLLAPYISNLRSVQYLYRAIVIGSVILLCVVPAILFISQADRFNQKIIYIISITEMILLAFLFWPGSFFLYLYSRDIRSCRNCDYEISGINLKATRFSDSALVQRFGQGCAERYGGGRGTVFARRFSSKKSNISVVFKKMGSDYYNSVAVSKESSSACISNQDLILLSTGKGVSLDDPEEKVLETYGPPSTEANNNLERVLSYIDYKKSGDSMNFGIVNRRVHSISVLLVKVD